MEPWGVGLWSPRSHPRWHRCCDTRWGANQGWVYSPGCKEEALSSPCPGWAGCPPTLPHPRAVLSSVTSHHRVPVLPSPPEPPCLRQGPGLRSWCLAPSYRGAPPWLPLHLPPQSLALPPTTTPVRGTGLLRPVPAAPPVSGCSWKSLREWETPQGVGRCSQLPPSAPLQRSPGSPSTSSGFVAVPAAPWAPAEGAGAGEEDEPQGEEQDLRGRDRSRVCPRAVAGRGHSPVRPRAVPGCRRRSGQPWWTFA